MHRDRREASAIQARPVDSDRTASPEVPAVREWSERPARPARSVVSEYKEYKASSVVLEYPDGSVRPE